MRGAILLSMTAVIGLAPGCRRTPASGRSIAIVAEPLADAGRPKETELDPATLGLAARPPEPTQAANDAVHDGLLRHRAGDFAASRALFASAVAASPTYALARYDLACAAARLGDLDAAAAELETLVSADLPGFAARIESDADLAPLRASPRGAALRARIASVRAGWHAAIADAVPAVMWRERRAAGLSYAAAKEAAWLRVGAWSPSSGRFLALAPDVPATNGWFSRGDRRAIVVDARIVRCQVDFCPNLASAHVSVFDEAGTTPVQEATYAARMFDATVAISVGSVRGTFRDCDQPDCDTGWMRIDHGTWAKDASPLVAPDVLLGSDPWGARLTTMPTGWAIDGKLARLTLPGGRTIALDPLHRDGSSTAIVDGDRALVATSHAGCDCGNPATPALHDHVVSVVELAAGRAHVWRKGAGLAALGADPGGGAYLQIDEAVERWRSIAAVEREPSTRLPDGVLLTAPSGAPDYRCGL